jgi:hypothetical protein
MCLCGWVCFGVCVCVCVALCSQHPLDAVCIVREKKKGVCGGGGGGQSEWSMGTISLVRVVGCAQESRRCCSYERKGVWEAETERYVDGN